MTSVDEPYKDVCQMLALAKNIFAVCAETVEEKLENGFAAILANYHEREFCFNCLQMEVMHKSCERAKQIFSQISGFHKLHCRITLQSLWLFQLSNFCKDLWHFVLLFITL